MEKLSRKMYELYSLAQFLFLPLGTLCNENFCQSDLKFKKPSGLHGLYKKIQGLILM